MWGGTSRRHTGELRSQDVASCYSEEERVYTHNVAHGGSGTIKKKKNTSQHKTSNYSNED